MDLSISHPPPPRWFTVSSVSALVCGAMTVAAGWAAGMCGEVFGGCQRFGDFGCGGYFVWGLWAAPIGAIGGAVVGGITAARMVKRPLDSDGAAVWKRSLGVALLSFVVIAALLVGIAVAVL